MRRTRNVTDEEERRIEAAIAALASEMAAFGFLMGKPTVEVVEFLSVQILLAKSLQDDQINALKRLDRQVEAMRMGLPIDAVEMLDPSREDDEHDDNNQNGTVEPGL